MLPWLKGVHTFTAKEQKVSALCYQAAIVSSMISGNISSMMTLRADSSKVLQFTTKHNHGNKYY